MKKRKQPSYVLQAKRGLGLNFKNNAYFEAALTHPSYRNENPCPKLEDFDRMEFFGDSVLNLAICRHLYKKFPNADEGLLSRLRSILVSRKILLRISAQIKLTKYIRLGKSLVDHKHLSKSKLVSDCLESLIAAIYFDSGYERAEKFILKHMRPYFDAKKLFRLDPNPKSTLQELTLKHWKKLPIYSQKPFQKGLKITVALNTRKKASAAAATRREAEEKAARLLIRKIRQDLSASSKRKSSGKKLRKTR